MPFPPQRDPLVELRLTGCLVISLLIFTACIVPFMLVDLMSTALQNLHLSSSAAMLVLIGIVFGSVINLPIVRYPLDHEVEVPVFEPIAGWGVLPQYRRMRQESVVAVNVGGCVIPVLLAIRMMRFIADGGSDAITVTVVGMVVNSLICYRMAQPVPNLGIRLPFFLPALVALTLTWFGLPAEELRSYRAPVAFVIGITGPLVGADLLHWKDFKKIAGGMVSIGGAGTWDGIVLSGLLAALFA